jgi:hypothetical protein
MYVRLYLLPTNCIACLAPRGTEAVAFTSGRPTNSKRLLEENPKNRVTDHDHETQKICMICAQQETSEKSQPRLSPLGSNQSPADSHTRK